MTAGHPIGPIGVWCTTDGLDAPAAAVLAADVQSLGYSALWIPETIGRDPFAHIAFLSARVESLVFATGIASIHHRHPGAMVQAANTLAEQTRGRFLLGVGVSHAPMVEGVRHLEYRQPLATVRKYLDAMDASPYIGPPPPQPVPRVLAALGPNMLALAAERADGAHTYWSTPEHTASARSILGPGKGLYVEQKVVLTDDADTARTTAAGALALYAGLPNYRNNWASLGFTPEEIDGCADRFVDAVVAWGSPSAIHERIDAHLHSGADHVCIQPLSPSNPFQVDRRALESLAPQLNEV